MTSWTVIWTRRALSLTMSQGRARHNARLSALECAARRREREDADQALAEASAGQTASA
ncbi:hypothetical protein [Nocardioides marmotae]|uniref:hypothetical protein n=1 Tax=Nocardioides marmotae TaxID=2663857 RepID=UPI0012B5E6C2|nr:hypothetical protein [Nocardioides marmotae]MBC9733905.1 hypothetical protein [Nocardioides marmotae]MTB85008.1 hypothetical protein [Nocardioides marmotae]